MLIKTVLAIVLLAILAGCAIYVLGLRQPSAAIARHDRVILIGLKYQAPGAGAPLGFPDGDVLWRGQAAMPLIGAEDIYWTDYMIVSPEADITSYLPNSGAPQDALASGLEDAFAAELRLVRVPAFAVGLMRASYLLGLARNRHPLPETVEIDGDQADLLPNAPAIDALLSAAPDRRFTMMNFLAYTPPSEAQPAGGRPAYQRYGQRAIRAVHAVGGQFLFAGQVRSVLIDSRHGQSVSDWDDFAAMIYPNPTAILRMDQDPAYHAALADRDAGLAATRVIATEAS